MNTRLLSRVTFVCRYTNKYLLSVKRQDSLSAEIAQAWGIVGTTICSPNRSCYEALTLLKIVQNMNPITLIFLVSYNTEM